MELTHKFQTIAGPSEVVYKVKASKFLAFAWPVNNDNEIKLYLQKLKLKYPDANHHCFAWRLSPGNDKYRFYDDGEPSGTAGRPIYGQILSRDLVNVLVVVVRYFGGIKLGTSGLIEAYKTSAALVLDQAVIVKHTPKRSLKIRFPYELTNQVNRLLKELNAEIITSNYQHTCELSIKFDASKHSLALQRAS